MSKPDGSLSAVVVSGGKQYRVAPGDQILVDRVDAAPGSTLKLDRVLLFQDGDELKVGTPAVDGLDVEVRVLAHRRGPRIESLRYKSKKRVRVHRGGRADLTAIQIIAVGGKTAEVETRAKTQTKTTKEKAGARKKAASALKAEVPAADEPAKKEEAAAPAERATRKAKETE